MNVDQARALTLKIQSGLVDMFDAITQASTGRAWAALGYDDWSHYVAAEFGGLTLPRGAIQALRNAGMSQRAIAEATGLGFGTVNRELATDPNGSVGPDRITGLDGKSRPATGKEREAADRRVRHAVMNTQRFMQELAALVKVGVDLDFEVLDATARDERIAVLVTARTQIESLINRLRKQGKEGA